jgi:hypothetical protein
MIKIKCFSDFCDSSLCKKEFEACCNAALLPFYGENKDIFITDADDYTHAIILNKAMPMLTIPKQNVLGLACEPHDFLQIDQTFIDYAKKHIHKYFIGDKRELPEPFIEYFGFMWFSRPPKEIKSKNKIMSIVLSDKTFAPGHAYRHTLVKKIIEYKLPIHIYGRGSNQYHNISKYVKGEFTNSEPYEDYLYTIAIENFRSNHYFSEKIITPIMYNCSPIYLGARYIHKYFDDILLLSGQPSNDINNIIKILKEPFKYYKKLYNEKHEKSVNLLQNIGDIFTL